MRGLLFLLASLLSPFCAAAEYTWGGWGGVQYPSASSAASSMVPYYCYSGMSNCKYAGGTMSSSGTRFDFHMSYTVREFVNGAWVDTQKTANNVSYTSRSGDSCPAGTVYNNEDPDGQCKAPEDPCAEKAGQTTSLMRSGKAPDPFMSVASNGYAIPQRTVCNGGCVAEATDMRCKAKITGEYDCRMTAQFTGVSCPAGGTGSGGMQDAPVDDGNEPPASLDDVRCTERLIRPDGSHYYMCQQTEEHKDPSDTSCGEVNGKWECIANPPDVPLQQKETKTEVTETPKPDGSKEITETKTVNVTTCSKVGACTTIGSVTNKTTVVNADGSSGGTTSTCTGSGCPTDSNPDKDGDGLGDCTTGNCEEEGGEFTGPENDEVGGFGDTLGTFKTRIEGAPIVAAAKGLSFSGGGSCSMGSNFTLFGRSMGFGEICGWANDWFGPLYSAMLALWALVAVRTFLEA